MRARQLAAEWALPVAPNPPRDVDDTPEEDELRADVRVEREKKECANDEPCPGDDDLVERQSVFAAPVETAAFGVAVCGSQSLRAENA